MTNSRSASQTRDRRRKKRRRKCKGPTQRQKGPTTDENTDTSFWDLKFESRLSTTWEDDNRPYREVWKAIESEIGLVRFFMTNSEAANRRVPPEVELVVRFCPESTREELESGSSLIPAENVSLLDDRTNDENPPISRGYLGPLNAYSLYRELQKKVRISIHISSVP